MNTRIFLMVCIGTVLVAATGTALDVFTAGAVPGEFLVKTDVVEGKLRADGLSNGFSPLKHLPTDTNLISIMGLLNFYRVFTTNHRYGEAMRSLPSEAVLEAPDTLRVHWPATEELPFDLTGVYHWVAQDTVDLETTVEAKIDLPDFEIFLSSYLSPEFPGSFVYAKTDTGNKFIGAEPEHGVWQVFPRDAAAVKIVKDGRWDIPPSPVDWAVRPEFAAPIICRRNEKYGVTVAMMAHPEDCFAVFTPNYGEGHYSMYFSLFGKTLKPGEKINARIRMVIGVLDDAALLKCYEEFLKNE